MNVKGIHWINNDVVVDYIMEYNLPDDFSQCKRNIMFNKYYYFHDYDSTKTELLNNLLIGKMEEKEVMK